MKLRQVCKVASGLLLILALQAGGGGSRGGQLQQGGAPAQKAPPASRPVVSRDTYERVLDILFPPESADGNVWTVVLRFRPSFAPESQIVVRRDVDGARVVEYASPGGRIYARLNEMLAGGGREDAAEMAKEIKVVRREVSVAPAQARRWHAALFESLAGSARTLRAAGDEFDKTGGESFVLDGTLYELRYEQGLNRMAFTLYDVEVDKPSSDGEFKLVRWMNAVRREVGRLR